MLLKVVRKVISDQAEGIIVFPKWSTQSWYTYVRENIREVFRIRKAPEQTLEIMTASLSDSTIKQYSVPIKQWKSTALKEK